MREKGKTKKRVIDAPSPIRVKASGSDASAGKLRDLRRTLLKDEALFFKIFRLIPDVIVISRLHDGMILDVNDHYLHVMGYTRDEVIGKTTTELHNWVHPKDRKIFVRQLQSPGQCTNLNMEFRAKGGGVIPALISGRIIEIGGESYVVSIAQNISELKKNEQELRYRAAFEHLITTISTQFINLQPDELDGGIRLALRMIGEFVGADRSYLFQWNTATARMDNTHEWCADGIAPQMHNLKGVNIEDEFPFLAKKIKNLKVFVIPRVAALPPAAARDKMHFQMQGIQSLLVVPMAYGGALAGFLGFDAVRTATAWSEDTIALLKIVGEIFVSALVRSSAEQSLRESEERFRSLFDNAQDGMLVADIQTMKFHACNRSICRMLGYTPEELQNIGVADIHPAGELQYVFEQFKKMSLGKLTLTENIPVKRKDGGIVFVDISASLVSLGGVYYVLGIFRDITERIRAQQQIAASERKYRELYNSIRDALAEVNMDGNITGCNAVFRDMLGYTDEELSRLTFEDITPEKWHAAEERIIKEEVLKRGHSGLYEKEYVRKDGRIIPVEVRTHVIRDDTGMPLGVGAVVRDISERKHAEEEKNRLVSILEATTDIVIMADTEGYLFYINQTGRKALGIDTSHGITRFKITDLHPAWAAKYILEEALPAAMRDGIWQGETAFTGRDGREIPTLQSIIGHRDSDGDISHFSTIARDITDRLQAEKERILLSSAVEQARDLIKVLGVDGTIQYVNPAAAAITGYTAEELVGRNPFQLKLHQDDERLYADLLQTIEQGRVWSGQQTNIKKDGTTIELESTISPIRSRSDDIIGYLGISHDVTQRLNLEKQLRQAQKMEAIGTLAGGIAHDFNNILSVIMGYTQLLLNTAEADSPGQVNLQEIFKAGKRARDLVQQILAFSRQTEQEVRPIHIAPVIAETIRFLRASLPSTISIRQDINDEPDIVLSDPTQIHQVLMNLCTNAAHAMKERGGVLSIGLAPVEITSHEQHDFPDVLPGAYLKLTVRDTGHGMSREIMERIFDPYFTTKGMGEGTGLGLSVAHGIIKNHGGSITVTSDSGEWTTFEILLPRYTVDVPAAPDESGILPRGSERILFVDDEEALVKIGRETLERFGYRVDARTDPSEALASFRAAPASFDLVITDKTMPGMTGFDLAGQLLSIRPDIPIILCTGFSDMTDPDTVQDMGIKELVMKPLVMRELAVTIRKVLDKK